MNKNQKPQRYNTIYQLKMPLEISKIIETSDPVYSFCEIMDSIDLRKYLAVKERKTGRKRYNPEILLKIILFAFMENGYASTREIEKYCKTDIRYMWLLDGRKAPSHMKIDKDGVTFILCEIEQYSLTNGFNFAVKELLLTENTALNCPICILNSVNEYVSVLHSYLGLCEYLKSGPPFFLVCNQLVLGVPCETSLESCAITVSENVH